MSWVSAWRKGRRTKLFREACGRNRKTRSGLTNTPRLPLFTSRESSPIDGGPSVVDARHRTLARLRLDAAGRLAGPADPDASPVDLLGDPADRLAGPGDHLGDPDDRLEDRDGRTASVAGPAGAVQSWLPHVHHAGIVAGPDESSPRPAACPDGLLACLGCLAEDRGGLLERPADPGGNPVGLVAYLADLGRIPRSGSRSVHR